MSVIDYTWEYLVEEVEDDQPWYDQPWYDHESGLMIHGSRLKSRLQKWGAEGWEVINCFCPDPRNFRTFRVVAKRRTGAKYI